MLKDSLHIALPSELISKINETQKGLAEMFKPFQEAIEAFIKNFPPSLRTLSSHGWYISGNFEIADTITLARHFDNGNYKKANRYLTEFYERESKIIISDLKHVHPDRSKILHEAFKAHKSKMYFASTALFLTIADGLCNGYLFKTKVNKANLKKELTRTHCLEEFLSLITEVSAIDIAHAKKTNFPSTLNRHGVLHGLDVDYGTKINSFKALSLLAFIGDFFTNRDNSKFKK